MNLSHYFLESIGWTLVHSLWQGAVIFALLQIVSRYIGTNAAQYRYVAGITALALMVASSLVTFLVIYAPGMHSNEAASAVSTGNALSLTSTSSIEAAELYSILSPVLVWLDINLIWIIRLWLIGSMAGLLKMAAGMLYISFLRRQAQPVYGNWEETVKKLAGSLRIDREVCIAESRVSTPVVIGYLKPLILFPVGMIAGLAPGQVEAILLHELAHVRRHDFIVNVFQCIVESLLFFNPFVWLISARVRAEREHCCDDTVIRYGIEPVVYVRALAAVEGAYSNGALAMGFLGQKNQLLNRMKRVMEKTVKKEVGGPKLLPLSLVAIGIVCASWLSIGMETGSADVRQTGPGIVPDTTITGDEDNSRSVDNHYSYAFRTAPFPHPSAPGIHSPGPFPFPGTPSPDVFAGDSIPGFLYVPGGEWVEFEREFTMKFREEFRDFFDKNKGQFEKMMKELREQHHDDAFMYRGFNDLSDEGRKALEERMALINPAIEDPWNFSMPGFPADVMKMQAESELLAQQALAASDLAIVHEQMARIQEQFAKEHEFFLMDQEERLRAYEKEIIDQLIKDGYLDEREKAKDLHIRNGEVTINGKKVKKSDEDKYRTIIDRYNSMPHIPRRPE